MESEEVLWSGKPHPMSFLGLYLLYFLPLLSQTISFILYVSMPESARSALSPLAPVLNWATGLSEPYSFVYAAGALIATLIGVLNWLARVDIKPLIFNLTSYALTELLRFLYPGQVGYATRLFVLGLASVAGIFGVDSYRRSFVYRITARSAVIKGGFLRKWERVVRKDAVSDIVVVRPLLGYLFGFAHIVPITQSQLGIGGTYSLGAVIAEKKSVGVLVGGGKHIKEVEARPWNCIYGVRDFHKAKEAILK